MKKSGNSRPVVALTMAMLLLIAAVVNAAVVYVAPGGSNDNSGTSPRNAFKNISSAINHAVTGDTVYVLPGHYRENISLKSGVNVFGAGPEQTMIEGFRDPKYAAAIPYCSQCHYSHIPNGGSMFNVSDDPSGTVRAVDVTNATLAGFTIALENQDFYYHGWNKAVFIKGNTDNTFTLRNNVLYTPPNTNNSNSSEPSGVGIGVMVGPSANPIIRSNTIYGPSLPLQSGYGRFGVVWGITGASGTSSSGDLRNNIIHGYNTGVNLTTVPTADYNAYSMNAATGITPTSNDLVANVAFRWGNYRLAENSAAIDRGDSAINDLDGTRSDMGAYGGSFLMDSDRDGIINLVDNCPFTSNPDQEDWDGNGVGNVCDEYPMGNITPPAITASIVAPDSSVQVCVDWSTNVVPYAMRPDCNNVVFEVIDAGGQPLLPVCAYPEYNIATDTIEIPGAACVTCKLSDRFPDMVGSLGNFTISRIAYESFVTDPWFDQNSRSCIDPITSQPTGDTSCRDIWIGSEGSGLSSLAKLAPVITWNPGLILPGEALSGAQLNATANIDGSLTYNHPLNSVLPPGDNTVTAVFTPADGFSYSSATVTRTIPGYYDWTGFFAPVENIDVINKVKAGSAVPIKFSLGGDMGLSVLAAGYPISVSVSSFAAVAEVNDITADLTTTAGSSGLSYDPLTGQYTYVWKTDKSWAKTNRQLQLKLKDGTIHKANFTFTK